MALYSNITQTIGSTPLIRFQRLGSDLPGHLYFKLEFFNPLGSVKDRIALSMIETAENSGKLQPGMRVIEPTSGNTGIALAFVCAAKGYPLTLVMPETMSTERRTLILMLGAELILTPGPKGMKGAIAKALELADQQGKACFVPSQFDNPANPEIHRKTTAEEIWKDTEGGIDILVAGVGTGGTATGIGEVLKSRKPELQVVVVEPEESPVISGGSPGPHKIQGIGAGFIPKNLNTKIIDSVEKVSSQEAFEIARRVIRTEGVPVGISSGAAIAAGLRLAARTENRGKKIVVIVPSYTERYLSTPLAAEEREKAQALVVQEPKDEYLKKL